MRTTPCWVTEQSSSIETPSMKYLVVGNVGTNEMGTRSGFEKVIGVRSRRDRDAMPNPLIQQGAHAMAT